MAGGCSFNRISKIIPLVWFLAPRIPSLSASTSNCSLLNISKPSFLFSSLQIQILCLHQPRSTVHLSPFHHRVLTFFPTRTIEGLPGHAASHFRLPLLRNVSHFLFEVHLLGIGTVNLSSPIHHFFSAAAGQSPPSHLLLMNRRHPRSWH